MNQHRNSEELHSTKKKIFWDKRIVLVVEIFLCIISGGFFLFGLYLQNSLIEGFFSGCFTALIVTLLGTIVTWKTETDVERTIKTLEEQTSARIEDIQRHTDVVSNQLNSEIKELDKGLSTLNKSILNFNKVLEMFSGKACTFCKNYIKEVKFNRRDCSLKDFFAKAKNSISILATNLESFVPYVEQLVILAKKDINVRIATIHPNFARSFNISRVTGNTPAETRWKDMKESLETFSIYANENEKNFHLRTYSSITPTLILIMVDNECYVAYLINGMRASDTIHFLFSEDSNNDEITPIYYFKKHFESVWNDKETVDCKYDEIKSLEYSDN